METVKIVDARMGRGKSSAAIQFMKDHSRDKRFLYITPLLTEVKRICMECGFSQPENTELSKFADLKRMLCRGESISSTHALFYHLDDEALELIRRWKYTLIVDEEIEVISKVPITQKDFRIVNSMIDLDERGCASWIDENYKGKLSGYKEIADSGFMFIRSNAMLEVVDPRLFAAFDDVYMLTYLFTGSMLEAYMKYAGFRWKIIGVNWNGERYAFTDKPDTPPPLDIGSLIHIVDKQKLNSVGNKRTVLSNSWISARAYDDPEVTALRNSMDNFFRNICGGESPSRMWTSFKDNAELFIPKNGRYRKNFVQIRARATNDYADRTNLAYMANRFADPNIQNFFHTYGIRFDNDVFALSEMLQWVWRSAIRNNKPINLYVPSKRMRDLLQDWIEKVCEGGETLAQAELPALPVQ